MRKVKDSRGSLTVEVPSEVPFQPQRYFAVYDVPSKSGKHTHKECEQFLLCLNGSCRVLWTTPKLAAVLQIHLLELYMPPMIWGTQYMYSRDAVLVFASLPRLS